ncbi:MAG: radical SAM protein [Candidatus Methanofastidiosia archaeon]|jgi:radical SAM protein with 4Fe4S-binding SPASM domain
MKLKSIVLYPTLRCNLECAHCWIQAGKKISSSELSLKEMLSIVDSAQDLGVESVSITGGEPFLREKEVGKLLEYLEELDVNSSIDTNGTLLTAQSKRIIAKTRPKVMISLDGATPQGFASLRGNPHLFNTVVENIKFLKDSGVPILCSMTIHKGNVDELNPFVKMAQDLGHIRLLLYIEVGRAKKLETKFMPDEISDVIGEVNSLMKENSKISSNLPLAFLDSCVSYYACPAGRERLTVLPNGDVSFCAYCTYEDNMVAGNIRKDPLKDIWEKGIIFKKFQKIESLLEGVCNLCIFKKYCKGSCRAWAYDRYGSLYAPYPLCQKLYEEGIFPEKYLLEVKKHG